MTGGGWRRWGPWWVGLAAWAAWTRVQWVAWDALRPEWGQDLAFFYQVLWSAAHGGPWSSPLLLEPEGFLRMVHFHPVFALLVPLVALGAGPRFLLALHAGLLALGAPLAARLVRASGGSAALGLSAALAWACWFPVVEVAVADFRPMAFWVPALFLLALGLLERRPALSLAGAALACLAREEAAYLLPAWGLAHLLLPLPGGRRRDGLLPLGVGLLWLGFLLAAKENLFFHFDPRRILAGEAPPGPPPALLRDRVAFLARALAGAFAPVLAVPAPLLASAGPAWWLLSDAHREWHGVWGPHVHVRIPLVTGLGIGGAVGLGRLGHRVARAWPAAGRLLLLALVAAVQLGAGVGRLREVAARHAAHLAERRGIEVAALWNLLDRVPPDAALVTDYRLVAAAAGRPVLWNAVHLYLEEAPPPSWTRPWPVTLEGIDAVLLPRSHPLVERLGPGWRQAARGGGYALWLRGP